MGLVNYPAHQTLTTTDTPLPSVIHMIIYRLNTFLNKY